MLVLSKKITKQSKNTDRGLDYWIAKENTTYLVLKDPRNV